MISYSVVHIIIFGEKKPQVPLVLFLPIPLSHVKNHHYLLYDLLGFQDPFYSARERRTELQKASRFPAFSPPPPKKPRESDKVPDAFENQGFGPQNSA